jgi:hypothetical protein
MEEIADAGLSGTVQQVGVAISINEEQTVPLMSWAL